MTALGSRGRRTQRARDRTAALLRRHPGLRRTLAAVAGRCGAADLDDRILRVTGDLAVARLVRPDGGTARLLLHRVAGRDQSALAVETDWRAFEAPMPAVFWALCCRLGGEVVDVGANTGIYALLALLADPARTVTAFEPVPAIRRLLSDNLALGRCGARGRVRAEAVGAQAGSATLFLPPAIPGGYVETSASLSAEFKGDVGGQELTVPVTTLDAWWRGAGRPAVAVVKIDVESREYDVLRGAATLVDAQRPVLFYELLPQGDAAAIAGWAAARDFVDIRLHPAEAVVGAPPSFDPEGWNHLLVHRVQLPAVTEVLRGCGLAVRAATDVPAL